MKAASEASQSAEKERLHRHLETLLVVQATVLRSLTRHDLPLQSLLEYSLGLNPSFLH